MTLLINNVILHFFYDLAFQHRRKGILAQVFQLIDLFLILNYFYISYISLFYIGPAKKR